MPLVVYDNSASSARQSSVTSGTGFTWTQTAAQRCYAIVVVLADQLGMDNLATGVVTFGSKTLPMLGTPVTFNNSNFGTLYVFGANNIPSGSQTITVTMTEAGKTFTGWGASFTYKNVLKVGALQTAFGTGNSQTVTVPSSVSHLVWGIDACDQGSATFTAFNLTSRKTQISGAPTWTAGDKIGAATIAVSQTSTFGGNWAAAGIDLYPSAMSLNINCAPMTRSSLW